MPVPVDELVRVALASGDPAEACSRALDALRGALGAERALLARERPGVDRAAVVYRSPEASEETAEELPFRMLGDQPTVVEPPTDHATMLGLRLRPRDDARWCVAVVRSRSRPWEAAEHDLLRHLGPYVALVLDHAIAHRQLADERARLRATAVARERFMSVLAHELRNPLAPILMWTSTLKRLRKDDADVLRATQAIEHAVNLERRLIDDMLDVSRLERGVLTLQRQRVDLRDLLCEVLELHRASAEQAGLSVARELASEPMPIDGDPERLRQLLGHLVVNAIKFTPGGGRIAVTLARRGHEAQLEVSDSGPGLPAEVQAGLFTPFLQGPNAPGGLGVGLAVARWLVELHGGTIAHVPHRNRDGVTFLITLPLATGAS